MADPRKGIERVYPTTTAKGINDDYTTSVVTDEVKDQLHAEMWRELARRNLFEGFIEIKVI